MADPASRVTPPSPELRFDSDRIAAFMQRLQDMAAGQTDVRLPISPRHDAVDAIAHAINVLVGELSWAAAREQEAESKRAAELQAAVASAEARNSAILQAIPDLMFVLARDGTYLDYHARDPKLLFAPSDAFLGRTVRDILPAPLADMMMDALERAHASDTPIVVEYELPMDEPRFFETRIVRAGADRLLSIVRDVTDTRRASARIRDLAQQLIASQEMERQRIARELHDDVGQRLTLLILAIDEMASEVLSEQSRARLRMFSVEAGEIASAVSSLAHGLHPAKLYALGLVAAIRTLCDQASQSLGLHIAFTHGPLPSPVDSTVSLCLYRIAQEALHNVVQHSRARDASVSLTGDEQHIALQITDSGVGFDPEHGPYRGLGLVSMRERVAFLGGQLAIDAAPGRGTQIAVHIPLASLAAESAPASASRT